MEYLRSLLSSLLLIPAISVASPSGTSTGAHPSDVFAEAAVSVIQKDTLVIDINQLEENVSTRNSSVAIVPLEPIVSGAVGGTMKVRKGRLFYSSGAEVTRADAAGILSKEQYRKYLSGMKAYGIADDIMSVGGGLLFGSLVAGLYDVEISNFPAYFVMGAVLFMPALVIATPFYIVGYAKLKSIANSHNRSLFYDEVPLTVSGN